MLPKSDQRTAIHYSPCLQVEALLAATAHLSAQGTTSDILALFSKDVLSLCDASCVDLCLLQQSASTASSDFRPTIYTRLQRDRHSEFPLILSVEEDPVPDNLIEAVSFACASRTSVVTCGCCRLTDGEQRQRNVASHDGLGHSAAAEPAPHGALHGIAEADGLSPGHSAACVINTSRMNALVVVVLSFASKPTALQLQCLHRYCGLAAPVLERQLYAVECQQTAHRKDQLMQLTRRVSAAGTTSRLVDVVDSVLDASYQLLDAARVTLFLVDDDRKHLIIASSRDSSAQGVQIPITAGLAGHAASTCETVWVHDAYQDKRFNPAVDRATGFRTQSVIACAIRDGNGDVVGVLQAVNRCTLGDMPLGVIQPFTSKSGSSCSEAAGQANGGQSQRKGSISIHGAGATVGSSGSGAAAGSARSSRRSSFVGLATSSASSVAHESSSGEHQHHHSQSVQHHHHHSPTGPVSEQKADGHSHTHVHSSGGTGTLSHAPRDNEHQPHHQPHQQSQSQSQSRAQSQQPHNRIYPFSRADVDVLEGMAAHAGIALRSVAILEETNRAKRTTAALMEVVQASANAGNPSGHVSMARAGSSFLNNSSSSGFSGGGGYYGSGSGSITAPARDGMGSGGYTYFGSSSTHSLHHHSSSGGSSSHGGGGGLNSAGNSMHESGQFPLVSPMSKTPVAASASFSILQSHGLAGVALLVQRIVDAAYVLLDCERVTLYLVDSVKQELWMAVTHDPATIGVRIPIGKGLAGFVAATGQALNITDAYNDPAFDPSLDAATGFKTQSLLVWPVTLSAGSVGALQGTAGWPSSNAGGSTVRGNSTSSTSGGLSLSSVGAGSLGAGNRPIAVLQAINKRGQSLSRVPSLRTLSRQQNQYHSQPQQRPLASHNYSISAPSRQQLTSVPSVVPYSSSLSTQRRGLSSAIASSSASAAVAAGSAPAAAPTASALLQRHEGSAAATSSNLHQQQQPGGGAPDLMSTARLSMLSVATSTATTNTTSRASTVTPTNLADASPSAGAAAATTFASSGNTSTRSSSNSSSTGPTVEITAESPPTPVATATSAGVANASSQQRRPSTHTARRGSNFSSSSSSIPASSSNNNGSTAAGVGVNFNVNVNVNGGGGSGAALGSPLRPPIRASRFDAADERAMAVFCAEVAVALKRRTVEAAFLKALADSSNNNNNNNSSSSSSGGNAGNSDGASVLPPPSTAHAVGAGTDASPAAAVSSGPGSGSATAAAAVAAGSSSSSSSAAAGGAGAAPASSADSLGTTMVRHRGPSISGYSSAYSYAAAEGFSNQPDAEDVALSLLSHYADADTGSKLMRLQSQVLTRRTSQGVMGASGSATTTAAAAGSSSSSSSSGVAAGGGIAWSGRGGGSSGSSGDAQPGTTATAGATTATAWNHTSAAGSATAGVLGGPAPMSASSAMAAALAQAPPPPLINLSNAALMSHSSSASSAASTPVVLATTYSSAMMMTPTVAESEPPASSLASQPAAATASAAGANAADKATGSVSTRRSSIRSTAGPASTSLPSAAGVAPTSVDATSSATTTAAATAVVAPTPAPTLITSNLSLDGAGDSLGDESSLLASVSPTADHDQHHNPAPATTGLAAATGAASAQGEPLRSTVARRGSATITNNANGMLATNLNSPIETWAPLPRDTPLSPAAGPGLASLIPSAAPVVHLHHHHQQQNTAGAGHHHHHHQDGERRSRRASSAASGTSADVAAGAGSAPGQAGQGNGAAAHSTSGNGSNVAIAFSPRLAAELADRTDAAAASSNAAAATAADHSALGAALAPALRRLPSAAGFKASAASAAPLLSLPPVVVAPLPSAAAVATGTTDASVPAPVAADQPAPPPQQPVKHQHGTATAGTGASAAAAHGHAAAVSGPGPSAPVSAANAAASTTTTTTTATSRRRSTVVSAMGFVIQEEEAATSAGTHVGDDQQQQKHASGAKAEEPAAASVTGASSLPAHTALPPPATTSAAAVAVADGAADAPLFTRLTPSQVASLRTWNWDVFELPLRDSPNIVPAPFERVAAEAAAAAAEAEAAAAAAAAAGAAAGAQAPVLELDAAAVDAADNDGSSSTDGSDTATVSLDDDDAASSASAAALMPTWFASCPPIDPAAGMAGEQRLKCAVYEMFAHFNLLQRFGIPVSTFSRFIDGVRGKYRPNAFHNYYHAVSVLHATFMLAGTATTVTGSNAATAASLALNGHGQVAAVSPAAASAASSSSLSLLPPLAAGGGNALVRTSSTSTSSDCMLSHRDILSIFIAALGHDIDHPGNNNAYEIATYSPLALTHNDDAVLERHHAATLWSLILHPNIELLASMAGTDGMRQVRKATLHAILHTDMSTHFTTVSELADRSARYQESLRAHDEAVAVALARADAEDEAEVRQSQRQQQQQQQHQHRQKDTLGDYDGIDSVDDEDDDGDRSSVGSASVSTAGSLACGTGRRSRMGVGSRATAGAADDVQRMVGGGTVNTGGASSARDGIGNSNGVGIDYLQFDERSIADASECASTIDGDASIAGDFDAGNDGDNGGGDGLVRASSSSRMSPSAASAAAAAAAASRRAISQDTVVVKHRQALPSRPHDSAAGQASDSVQYASARTLQSAPSRTNSSASIVDASSSSESAAALQLRKHDRRQRILSQLPPRPTPFDRHSDPDRLHLIAVLVHTADLSGQAYPREASLNWSARVMVEFEAQAAAERHRGLPVAPFMQALDLPLSACRLQLSFITNIVMPLWQRVADVLPGLDQPLANLEWGRRHYEDNVSKLQREQQQQQQQQLRDTAAAAAK